MSDKTMALDLFDFAGVSKQVAVVFAEAQIKNKKDQEVGTRFKRAKRSEVAEVLDLKGKANADRLTRIMQEVGKDTWHQVRGKLSELNDYELMSLSEQINTKGERVVALRIREVVERVDIEGIAKQLGMTVEEVKAKLDAQRKAATHIDVPSAPVTPPALPPAPPAEAAKPASQPAKK